MTTSSGSTAVHWSRALVLGGGGPVGRAWEIGLLDGFADQGIALGTADVIIGTSAGAVVGAHLALQQGLGAPPDIIELPPVPSDCKAALADAMERAALSVDPEPVRAEIGKMALDAQTLSEEASVSRAMFAPFIGKAWPQQLLITTVNARTGQLRIWDASSGAPLERAIAASTAAPCVLPPITIGSEQYIDGGVRSALNADLAIGADLVVAVSCFALTGAAIPDFFETLNSPVLAELDAVRSSGATLAVVEPQPAFLALTDFGDGMMDGSLIPEAYRLGRTAADTEGASLRRIWNSP